MASSLNYNAIDLPQNQEYEENAISGVRGEYQNNQVNLSRVYAASPRVLLHELTHAAWERNFGSPFGDTNGLSPQSQAFWNQLVNTVQNPNPTYGDFYDRARLLMERAAASNRGDDPYEMSAWTANEVYADLPNAIDGDIRRMPEGLRQWYPHLAEPKTPLLPPAQRASTSPWRAYTPADFARPRADAQPYVPPVAEEQPYIPPSLPDPSSYGPVNDS